VRIFPVQLDGVVGQEREAARFVQLPAPLIGVRIFGDFEVQGLRRHLRASPKHSTLVGWIEGTA